MRTSSQNGSALVVSAGLLTIVAVWVGIVFTTSTTTAKFTKRSADHAALQAAANGALEYAYGSWRASISNRNDILGPGDINNLVLNNYTPPAGMELFTPTGMEIFSPFETTPPTPSGLVLVPLNADGTVSAVRTGGNVELKDQNGTIVTNPQIGRATLVKPQPARIPLAGYPGWTGFNYQYMATVGVRSINQPDLKVTVRRKFQCNMISLFQTMYFYENNLELFRPANMKVGGLVHTNGNLNVSYSSDGGSDPENLTFQGNVSHVGNAYLGNGSQITTAMRNWNPDTVTNGTVYAPVFPNGQANQVAPVARMEPLGTAIQNVFNPSDANPNNDGFNELIEMPVTTDPAQTDPPEINRRRFSTKAGIIVDVDASGNISGFTTQNGLSSLSATQQTNLTAARTSRTTIYDYRESNNVDVVDIDVNALSTTLQGIGGFNKVIYFNLQPSGTYARRAIRLKNGAELKEPLTIVSSSGVYIQGDYNARTASTPSSSIPSNGVDNNASDGIISDNRNNDKQNYASGYTVKPSAVVGDAVMVLSNSFQDSWLANSSTRSGSVPSGHAATNTTVNTAIMAGIVPTGNDPSSSTNSYSGGANNFIRFEEGWSNTYCTYYGSMVQLFNSKVFSGKWKRGNLYVPPLRRWNFDTQFTTNPPPGSLDPLLVSRGPWEAI